MLRIHASVVAGPILPKSITTLSSWLAVWYDGVWQIDSSCTALHQLVASIYFDHSATIMAHTDY